MSNSASTPNQLKDDHQLTDRPFIRSLNGRYFAMIGQHGDFVLRDEEKKTDLWSSETKGQGTGPYRVEMKDGNLVLYDSKHTILFSSNTEKKGLWPHRLEITDHGTLCIKDGKDEIIWSCGGYYWPGSPTPIPTGCQLISTDRLYKAELLAYTLGSTSYCSLVVYSASIPNPNPGNVLYNSNTPGSSTNVLHVDNTGVYITTNTGTLAGWIYQYTGSGSQFALVLNSNPDSLTFDEGFPASLCHLDSNGPTILDTIWQAAKGK